jgi:hypothetical protein
MPRVLDIDPWSGDYVYVTVPESEAWIYNQKAPKPRPKADKIQEPGKDSEEDSGDGST